MRVMRRVRYPQRPKDWVKPVVGGDEHVTLP